MAQDKTTITTERATRDQLHTLAKPNESLDTVINRLITHYRSTQARNRLAWESRIAQDRKDSRAVAWAERQADILVDRLEQRKAAQG
ncbi:hypothetical protein [Nocardia sp. IFM 10818]